MEPMKKICELVENELSQFASCNKLNVQDVDAIYKLIDIYKDIKTIEAMEDSSQPQMQSYSSPMRSYTSVTTPSGNTYGYQEGMNTYRGRNSMGRFTRDTAKNDIIRMLEESMNKVTSEADREVLIRCIEQLGN